MCMDLGSKGVEKMPNLNCVIYEQPSMLEPYDKTNDLGFGDLS